ncbi:MAG: 4Fe-4S binding protein, partial [Deltaproteobacteria bacterium]|nr:4Fe-4S binding protein [Deltaproteobacteria bacterium]
RLTQLVFLGGIGEFSFYGIFRCPFAVPYVSCGSCPVVQCPGRKLWWGFWIALFVSAILFGRAFCGWACPGGMISEILEKFSLAKGKIKGSLEKVLGWGKYLVLMASLVIVFLMNNPRWAIPIRTGNFFNSVRLTFEHADNFWIFRTVFVLTGLGLGIIIPHFWCRYLCPTGGCLELFRKISIFRYFKTNACNDCDKCRKRCSLETRPKETNCSLETRPKETNCTNCGACSNVCPVDAIRLGTER